MADVVDILTGNPWRAGSGSPSIDALTVEVAVAIWRLGGRADGYAVADAVAQGRGRSEGFSPSERLALNRAIEESVDARADKRLQALLSRTAENDEGGWALTPLACAVLGQRPGG